MQRLNEVLKKYKKRQFVWGEADCCLFACDCVFTMTGIDPAAKFRGKYNSEMSAKKALAKIGGIEQTMDKLFPRVHFNFAKRCDLILYESELGQTVGLVWSNGLLVMGPDGYVLVTEFEPIAVWSIL